MSKYHTNPETGMPGPCTATNGRCPYGGANAHHATPQAAVAAWEREFERRQRASAVPSPASKPKVANRPAGGAPGVDHSVAGNIQQAMAGAGSRKSTVTLHSILAPQRMNPATGEGDAYGHYARGAVILGKADGSRIRVAAGGSELFARPAEELGRRVFFYKQQKNGEGMTDLHVLGYVDSAGNKYGYVPDKKVHYFVLK